MSLTPRWLRRRLVKRELRRRLSGLGLARELVEALLDDPAGPAGEALVLVVWGLGRTTDPALQQALAGLQAILEEVRADRWDLGAIRRGARELEDGLAAAGRGG